jgi:hypothetical protein
MCLAGRVGGVTQKTLVLQPVNEQVCETSVAEHKPICFTWNSKLKIK